MDGGPGEGDGWEAGCGRAGVWWGGRGRCCTSPPAPPSLARASRLRAATPPHPTPPHTTPRLPPQIRLGTLEQDHAENEWALRAYVRSAKKAKLSEEGGTAGDGMLLHARSAAPRGKRGRGEGREEGG